LLLFVATHYEDYYEDFFAATHYEDFFANCMLRTYFCSDFGDGGSWELAGGGCRRR
jgi:hypothetical protein